MLVIGHYGGSLRHLVIDSTDVCQDGLRFHASCFHHLTSLCIFNEYQDIPLKTLADKCSSLQSFTLSKCGQTTHEDLVYFFEETKNTLQQVNIYQPLTGNMFKTLEHCTSLRTLKIYQAELLTQEDLVNMFRILTELRTLAIGNRLEKTKGIGRVIANALQEWTPPGLLCMELINVECRELKDVLPLACPRLRGFRLINCLDGEWSRCAENIVKGCENLTFLELRHESSRYICEYYSNRFLFLATSEFQKIRNKYKRPETFMINGKSLTRFETQKENCCIVSCKKYISCWNCYLLQQFIAALQ